ncbi:TraB/GumN family protein [Rhizobium paknamense]|uniref:Uncharacterized protein YbaP (TraB family) n=1 Tax=Rhizobium paknamense TaxID=1206817 RepID=A0ABU0IEE6_9HYPH|nr:TraB/GumN family protein [Rhizobium paknamense]MDQ0456616.1 uncharacterized protein YbaP (TraB family) [Rhizobium paknamense]
MDRWLKQACRAAAALPLMLLLLLLSTLALVQPARSEDASTCHAHNLLPEFEKTEPEAFARVQAEARQTPNGNSIFWKLEKPGREPSWLLGTMHLTDPRVTAMPPAAREAFQAADTVVLESDEILDPKKAAFAILAKPEFSTFTDGSTLTGLLSAEDVATIDAALKPKGLSVKGLNRMKPWLISAMLALPGCEMSRKGQGGLFLDMKLAVDAAKAGKEVLGVETLAEQFEAMNAVPIDVHLKSLVSVAKAKDQINDVMETMIDLYLNGQIGMITPTLRAAAPDGTEATPFEQRMIVDRNKVMAQRGGPILDNGNVFMAVGALHLPGKDGLIELLRQQGFTITPVASTPG